MAAPSEQHLIRSRRDLPCPDGCTLIHSYTSDDTRWCLRAPGWGALDVERSTTPPPALAARLTSDEDFWRAWTRLEVVAKLTDTPVLTLLGRGLLGSPEPGHVEVAQFVVGDAVVCCGRLVSMAD